MSSVTKQCQKECGVVHGWSLALIDTTGWIDSFLQQSEIIQEVLKCLAMCSSGSHVYLLIIPIARFTQEQQQTVDMVEAVCKENFNHYIYPCRQAGRTANWAVHIGTEPDNPGPHWTRQWAFPITRTQRTGTRWNSSWRTWVRCGAGTEWVLALHQPENRGCRELHIFLSNSIC